MPKIVPGNDLEDFSILNAGATKLGAGQEKRRTSSGERSLLRPFGEGDFKRSVDAIPLSLPIPRRQAASGSSSTKTMQNFGTFRPRNTLSRPQNSASPLKHNGRRVSGTLQTISVQGGNVLEQRIPVRIFQEPEFRPPSKKRKIETEVKSSPQNAHVIIDSDDDTDQLAEGKIRKAISSQAVAPQSQTSQEVSFITAPSLRRSSSGHVSGISHMMSSNSYAKKTPRQREALLGRSVQADLPVPTSRASSVSSAPEPSQIRRITAGPKESMPRENGSFMARDGSRDQHQISLGESFVDISGAHRGAPANRSSSPDVLSNDGITNAWKNHRPSSPMKALEQLVPRSIQDALVSTINTDGLEPSSVIHSRVKERPSRKAVELKRKHAIREEVKSEGYGLRYICADGFFHSSETESTSPFLGIEFVRSSHGIKILVDGEDKAQKFPTLSIRAEKLIKIIWADNSEKLRLEGSLLGKRQLKIDLGFWNTRDAVSALQRIDSFCKTIKVQEVAKVKLDQMFTKMAAEILPDLHFHGTDGMDAELALLERRRANRLEDESRPLATGNSSNVREKLSRRLQRGKRPSADSTLLGLVENADIGSQRRSSPRRRSTRLHNQESIGYADELSVFPFQDTWSYKNKTTLKDLKKFWKKPLVFHCGKKKASVDFDDILRLDEGVFLNDNLLQFYLHYLEQKLTERDPEAADHTYWFSTYFYTSLTKDPKESGYERVARWTKDVDLFKKHYIVVPINEHEHWFLAVICNPHKLLPAEEVSQENSQEVGSSAANLDAPPMEKPADIQSSGVPSTPPPTENFVDKGDSEKARESLARLNLDDDGIENLESSQTQVENAPSTPELFKDIASPQGKDSRTYSNKHKKRKSGPPPQVFDPDQPAIFTMDSLGNPRSSVIKTLKNYLHMEAITRRSQDLPHIQGMTAKGIPQQDNFCDCGLFVLGYLEKFSQSPRSCATSILQKTITPAKDWPNFSSPKLRAEIRNLVLKLHAEQFKYQEKLTELLPSLYRDEVDHSEIANTETPSIFEVAQQEEKETNDEQLQRSVSTTREDALASALLVGEPSPTNKTEQSRPHEESSPPSWRRLGPREEIHNAVSSPNTDETLREPANVILVKDSQDTVDVHAPEVMQEQVIIDRTTTPERPRTRGREASSASSPEIVVMKRRRLNKTPAGQTEWKDSRGEKRRAMHIDS